MDLDTRIDRKRSEALRRQSLDVEWFDDSVSMYTIYSEIEREAQTLNTGEGKYKTNRSGDALERLRGVDARLQKIWFYRVCVRGILKKMYKKRKQAVYGDENEREFVRHFQKKFRIPVLGRIFRALNNFLHVNRNITRLIQWNQEQENRIENLEERIGSIQSRLEDVEKTLRANMILERVDSLERDVRIYNDWTDQSEKALKEAEELLQTVVVEISNMRADLTKIRKTPEKLVPEEEVKEHPPAFAETSSDEYLSIDYFDFENRFRGSREYVKNSQAIYIPYFAGRNHVVDLGCGRGEFTELLQEHEIGVKGVDLYAPYVEYCKMRSLPVEHGDAIDFLRRQDEVDGVFVGQMVEHISTEQMIKLCQAAYDKLKDGCYLIMETPNPTSLAIYTQSFYMDPSHKRPVHPRTLQYLVEKQGFSDVQIVYTESSRVPCEIPRLSDKEEGREHEFDVAMQRVSELLYGSQDYAVIAKK